MGSSSLAGREPVATMTALASKAPKAVVIRLGTAARSTAMTSSPMVRAPKAVACSCMIMVSSNPLVDWVKPG